MSDKMMDRVQKLLNQAAGAATDAERETFQAKAEQLMHQHKIDEAMLRIRNAGKAAEEKRAKLPTDTKMEFVDRANEFHDQLSTAAVHLARLADVRIVFSGWDKLRVVGYADDISYFQMLWVSTHLTFSGRMFPEWDEKLPPSALIRLFIEAGYKWDYVWDMAAQRGRPFTRLAKGQEILVPRPPADNGWMKRQLKKAYDETGEEKPKLTHAVGNYRLSYAQGFVDVVTRRADAMYWERRNRENEAGNGVSLVLAKDADAVQDYFNSLYPPGALTSQEGSKRIGTDARARSRGAAAGSAVDFSGGQGGLGAAARKEIG